MAAWGACVAGALDVTEYVGGLLQAGFVDVQVTPKDSASRLLESLPDGAVFSATVTAARP
jgi:hypothetical protein